MKTFNRANLLEARLAQDLTQLEVAIAMRQLGVNIDPSTLSNWESGAGCPQIDVLPVLVKVLKIEIDDLFDGR